MALTIDELRKGIQYWRDSKPDWPKDFHNAYYQSLPPASGVFNLAWWDRFYPILRDWVATRPLSRAALTAEAMSRFSELEATWKNVIVAST